MVSSRARPWLKWALILGAALPGRAQDLLSVGNPSQAPPPGSWSAEAYAFACSDPIPLHGFFNHWQGGFTPGRDPVTCGCWGLETRAAAGPWSLSVWDRTTFLARMSPDGARLIWLAKQKLVYPQGEIFNLHLDLGALHRDGVSVGRALRLGDLALGASLGFWTATNAQFGTVNGEGWTTGTRSYGYDAVVDYHYNQNRLYDLPVPSHRGQGWGLDLGAGWDAGPWKAQAAVRDLLNETRWSGLPMTTATVVSGRTHTDSQGYQVFDPAIEGWEGSRPFTWRESAAWSASLQRRLQGWSAEVRVERTGPVTLRALEASAALAGSCLGTLGFEQRNRLWTAGARWTNVWLNFGLSSLSAQRAHGASLTLGLRGGW